MVKNNFPKLASHLSFPRRASLPCRSGPCPRGMQIISHIIANNVAGTARSYTLTHMQPLILLTILTILTGCARFQARPLNPADSATRLEARTLTSAGLREFIDGVDSHKNAWPPPAWDLDKLTLAAMHYHPDLALAPPRRKRRTRQPLPPRNAPTRTSPSRQPG